ISLEIDLQVMKRLRLAVEQSGRDLVQAVVSDSHVAEGVAAIDAGAQRTLEAAPADRNVLLAAGSLAGCSDKSYAGLAQFASGLRDSRKAVPQHTEAAEVYRFVGLTAAIAHRHGALFEVGEHQFLQRRASAATGNCDEVLDSILSVKLQPL